MAILAPSILSCDYMNMKRDFDACKENGVKWLHVDIMDGHFVPNLSFGYSLVKSMRPVNFCKAGADYLTIHVEADTPENIRKTLELIRSLGVKPGIVVKPKTPAEAIEEYLPMVDMVLVMTVEPGFGGQKFMADMMPKVKKLRQMLDKVNPACHLEVDGGVDLNTVLTCKENGADVFVAGSAYFGAQDKKAFTEQMEK